MFLYIFIDIQNQFHCWEAFNAFSTSWIISSIDSRPTESLIKLSVIPNLFLVSTGTDAWVMNAGTWPNDSTPPNDSAKVKMCDVFKNLEACYLPPLILKVIMAPKPLICFLATSWYLKFLRPGYEIISTAGFFSIKWAKW